jgi:hypothetical protein
MMGVPLRGLLAAIEPEASSRSAPVRTAALWQAAVAFAAIACQMPRNYERPRTRASELKFLHCMHYARILQTETLRIGKEMTERQGGSRPVLPTQSGGRTTRLAPCRSLENRTVVSLPILSPFEDSTESSHENATTNRQLLDQDPIRSPVARGGGVDCCHDGRRALRYDGTCRRHLLHARQAGTHFAGGVQRRRRGAVASPAGRRTPGGRPPHGAVGRARP